MQSFLDWNGRKYTLKRCPKPRCGGVIREHGSKWYCRDCAAVIPKLPANLNASNVARLTWKGGKWEVKS